MMNVTRIRNKYPDHRAIQCICDAFDYQDLPIAMRARAPLKVLEALMWNRGIHMVLAGLPQDEVRSDNTDYDLLWKDVLQIAIDAEVFDEDNVVIVKEVKETPNGILVSFEPPSTKRDRQTFRKKLLKIKRTFMSFGSWGDTVLEPYVP
jgi:hypothetical protein